MNEVLLIGATISAAVAGGAFGFALGVSSGCRHAAKSRRATGAHSTLTVGVAVEGIDAVRHAKAEVEALSEAIDRVAVMPSVEKIREIAVAAIASRQTLGIRGWEEI